MNPVCDKTWFKLPIEYLEETVVHELLPTVASDLELVVSASETPSMYSTLLQPKTEFDHALIPRIGAHYTTDVAFLQQSQEIVQSCVPKAASQISKEKAEKLLHIWRDLYEVQGTSDTKDAVGANTFHDRYGYIDFQQLRFINKMSTFMGYWTIINLISPIFSIILPFLFIVAPFVILRIQSVPITFSTYIDMLKNLAKSHAIGKTLTSFENFSINNLIYVLFTLAMYGMQMYQNCKHCVRFYNNIHTVNDHLLTVREFVDTSIVNIETFLQTGKTKSRYSEFCNDAERRLVILREMKEDLSGVEHLDPGVINVSKKCFDIGYLLKTYYSLHDIAEYKDAFGYAISFDAYRAALFGIADRVSAGAVNYGTLLQSKGEKGEKYNKFVKQTYPAISGGIANDLSLDKNLIITGPNASGKTTQLKTTAINIIFTQQFGVGFYEACDLAPYTHIHSYLNIPDTSGRDSLFQAEARRCKEIIDVIDALKTESRHFCIFDELFSGTNAEEATSVSYAFLKYLQKHENVDFILTTHFVKLCKKVKKSGATLRIANYKMDAALGTNNDIQFSYKLVKGISKIKAARLILIQMGFPDEIVGL